MTDLVAKKPLIDSETEELIIAAALDGKTIKKIRELYNIGSRKFYDHVDRSPHFAARLSRARNESLEELADSLLSIADDEADVNKARLKSDNIKWLLSKRKASTYGDRIEVNVTETISITDALAAARARASLPIIKPDNVIDAESKVIATDSESVEDIFS